MLTDRYQRKMNYLRVSVTDKCNLRCVYCMPSEGVNLLSHDEVLRNEEFVHLIDLFIGLGVRKLRFTGGEPLVRKGFLDIAAKVKELHPGVELCLTTNGVILDEALGDLRRIGLNKLNISLDTMSRARYTQLTGRDHFDRVISNIEKALESGSFDIKINAVLFRESLDELDTLLDFFKERNVTLRFIERMPFIADDRLQTFVPSDTLIETLKKKGSLRRDERIDTNVAMMFELLYRDRYPVRIGVIPPMTHKFCSRCNRLRLTCDGLLKTCLHSARGYDIKSPYRMDTGDDALRRIILQGVAEKPKEHALDCLEDNQGCCSLENRIYMSRIGG